MLNRQNCGIVIFNNISFVKFNFIILKQLFHLFKIFMRINKKNISIMYALENIINL